jgi:F-type H+-transporting ATPase subunit a
MTLFFFVLACNLMGMVPWLGAPTGSWGTTMALAAVTFVAVIVAGMFRFGPLGFVLNQIPHMDLPLVLAVVIKPMILLLELFGLCIKHLVLSIRLLANMVAGHIVLLGIMGLAFSAVGAASQYWGLSAVVSLIAATLFSCLELLVAFLQAYIFAFLSALFIGAAIHHH